MKTVFIPPICNWNFLKQLPQQIASQWAKNGYKVIYCNEKSGMNLKIEEVEPNLFVYPNFDYAYHCIKHENIGIDIFYNTAAKNHKYHKQINPKYTIYHSCDSFEEWKKEEAAMIKLSDVVLCTSQFIYDLRIKQHDNVHLVRNGCSEEMINMKFKEMGEFRFIKKPICVFSGACGKWVSTYHIRNVAKEYYTIFIGMAFGKSIPDNAIHYQAVDHNSLSNFLHNMDLGLLPFNTKMEVTQAANPIKLWEYLACGLPVIATDWAETNREELKDVVFVPKNDNEYIDLIRDYENLDKSEKLKIKEKCFEVARNNTWEKRFKKIQEIIGG